VNEPPAVPSPLSLEIATLRKRPVEY